MAGFGGVQPGRQDTGNRRRLQQSGPALEHRDRPADRPSPEHRPPRNSGQFGSVQPGRQDTSNCPERRFSPAVGRSNRAPDRQAFCQLVILGGVQPGRQDAGDRLSRQHCPAVERGDQAPDRQSSQRRSLGRRVLLDNFRGVQPRRETLATSHGDGWVRLWDVATGQQIGSPLNAGPALDSIDTVAFSPDGTTLAIGTMGGSVQLWDVATGQQIGSPLNADGAGASRVQPRRQDADNRRRERLGPAVGRRLSRRHTSAAVHAGRRFPHPGRMGTACTARPRLPENLPLGPQGRDRGSVHASRVREDHSQAIAGSGLWRIERFST